MIDLSALLVLAGFGVLFAALLPLGAWLDERAETRRRR